MKDFALVHAGYMDGKELDQFGTSRLAYAAKAFQESRIREIVVAGKFDNINPEFYKRTELPMSRLMKIYLVSQGIPMERVHEEPDGETTIQCTELAFRNIIVPRGWTSGIVVSNLEHLPRTALYTYEILKIMKDSGELPVDLELRFEGPSIHELKLSPERRAQFMRHEMKRIEDFLRDGRLR